MSAQSRHDRRAAATYARTRPRGRGAIGSDEIEAFERLTVSQLDVLVAALAAQRPLARETRLARQAWSGFPADDLTEPLAVMWMVASAGVPFALPPIWALRHTASSRPEER